MGHHINNPEALEILQVCICFKEFNLCLLILRLSQSIIKCVHRLNKSELIMFPEISSPLPLSPATSHKKFSLAIRVSCSTRIQF